MEFTEFQNKAEAILQTPLPSGEAIVAEEVLYLMSGRLEHSVAEKKITASAGRCFYRGSRYLSPGNQYWIGRRTYDCCLFGR